MRKVVISDTVDSRIDELRRFLIDDYKLSEAAALERVRKMRVFLKSLGHPGDYALCRFERWHKLGFRCVPFEGWVFAYESFADGIIIRDMSHGKLLADVAN